MGNVKRLIRQSDTEVLVCRIDRHMYDRRLSEVEEYSDVVIHVRICGTCGTKRRQTLTWKGRIISNVYVYPKDKGYQVKGVGPLDTDDMAELRIHLIRQRAL